MNTYFTGARRFPLVKTLTLEISEGQRIYTSAMVREIEETGHCLGIIFIAAPTLEQAIAQIEGGERQLKLKYKRYLATGETG